MSLIEELAYGDGFRERRHRNLSVQHILMKEILLREFSPTGPFRQQYDFSPINREDTSRSYSSHLAAYLKLRNVKKSFNVRTLISAGVSMGGSKSKTCIAGSNSVGHSVSISPIL